MAPIDRTQFNLLIDDDGTNTVGTIWGKADIQNVILDPVDAGLNGDVFISGARFVHRFHDPAADDANTFVGLQAGNLTMSPGGGASPLSSYNVGVGTQVLFKNTTGGDNTAVGALALVENTTGSHNCAFGTHALIVNTTGHENTALGVNALFRCATASNNTAIGYTAMAGGDGPGAGIPTTASECVAVGVGALQRVISGSFNTAVGVLSASSLTGGSYNVAVGWDALLQATASSKNTAIGLTALASVVTGDANVALGCEAGYYETGSNKLFIDNARRASEADARGRALIYGQFDADVANQFVRINGRLDTVGTIATQVSGAAKAAVDPSGLFVGPWNAALNTTEMHHMGYVTANDQWVTGSLVGDLVMSARPAGGILFGSNGVAATPVQLLRLHYHGQLQAFVYGAGTATFDATGKLTSVSDARLKNRIEPLPYGLPEVCALRPIQHGYTEASGLDVEGLYGGFVAQDVQAVIPLAVGRNPAGDLTLADRPILGAVVHAIQALTARLTALEGGACP